MTGEIFRVPRTTALFINALSRIIRDELGYPAYVQESWTFEHTAQWVECGSKGSCVVHGVSVEAYQEFVAVDGPGPWPDYDRHYLHFMPCYEYRLDTYMGEGFFFSDGRRVQVCCRISLIHSDAMGDLIDIELWLKDGQGPVQSLRYDVFETGDICRDVDKLILAFPPNRFAFWKDHSGLKTKRKNPKGYRLERLLRQHVQGRKVTTTR